MAKGEGESIVTAGRKWQRNLSLVTVAETTETTGGVEGSRFEEMVRIG